MSLLRLPLMPALSQLAVSGIVTVCTSRESTKIGEFTRIGDKVGEYRGLGCITFKISVEL